MTRKRVRWLLAPALLLAVVPILAGPNQCGDTTPMPAGRLFSGAPPTINHAVESLGRQSCLMCHGVDSTVAKSSPHPELTRCRQCHVVQRTRTVFRENTFRAGHYLLRQRAHVGAPWLIPHPLTLRENCLACHGGPLAHPAIRTSHPERRRCLQCHVPAYKGWPGPRPVEVVAPPPAPPSAPPMAPAPVMAPPMAPATP